MPVNRRSALLLSVALLTLLSGCRSRFRLTDYPTNERLYTASLAALEQGRNDHAIQGFERLTLELSARDTLLPRAHYHLARAHANKREWLLSASSYVRLQTLFPEDSLAPRSMLEAARAYERIWRRPDLDTQYGEAAMEMYGNLLTTYPNSPLRDSAFIGIEGLQDKFARKDYENGVQYFRKRAFDSAIMYFKDVIERYSETPTARLAYMHLVRSYRALRYDDDAREVCQTVLRLYPGDDEVASLCGGDVNAARAPAS